ncbi:putative amidohydrolase [Frondihabitans sp. PhB188]|uniref:nitrilase family protein n=1 Tax=Frondihabitans sp. PhB188 TaxID=2485200 RepID=UPI000F4873B2|nr:nitrilase family protein [Frondihabitans sp. PhB188]ROQ30985.1 putative amidohydrolase [Frondihabitans sp. PhB188]
MIRLAVVQYEPEFGNIKTNLHAMETAIRAAAADGAAVVVLPELSNSGYMFASRDEAFSLSEVVGEGPATALWKALAQELHLYIVAGLTERVDASLYNAAILHGPDGYLATYRKVHLWDEEALYFEPGNLGFPVVTTPIGRLGMMICYDGWFPESYRSLALGGVDIVCVPTNWVPIPGQQPGQPGMATILTMANAHSNGVIVAAADRVGTERGQEFIGQSLIVDHTGWPVAGPASLDGSEIILGDVDVAEARRSRAWGAFNNPVKDRRLEAYGVGAAIGA